MPGDDGDDGDTQKKKGGDGYGDTDGEPSGGGKREKANNGKKKKKNSGPDPQDWEWHGFPKMEDRDMYQANVDPETLQKMQDEANAKIKASKTEDAAKFKRKWKLNFSVTGIQNLTATPVEVFVAISVGNLEERSRKKTRNIKSKFNYTRAYLVKGETKKVFKAEELVYNKPYELSYTECQQKEVVLDLWATSKYNFNTLLGTAARSLYDLGNQSIYQSIGVFQPGDDQIIGYIWVKAVFTEIFEFKIVATNWQFNLLPELEMLANPSDQKKMRIGIPTEAGGGNDTFETPLMKGPRYCWANAGEFKYVGTEVSLATEAIAVSVLTPSSVQGKAIVSLASAGDYPIAQGALKKISRTPAEYVQGTVGGSLQLSRKSLLLKPGDLDENSSVDPPKQPSDSLVTYFLSPKIQYLIVDLFSADGLPIADQDTGTSNPFARVKYDGMVQQTSHVEATLGPVFSHTFYIPVRVPDEQIRSNKDHYTTLLPVEMQSKGYLEVELWHWDSVPTEFLGSVKIDLQRTRFGEEADKAICDKIAKAKTLANDVTPGAGGDGDVAVGIHPGLSRVYSTRVLELRREKIGGSWLHSPVKSTVSLDCYFVPDFPDDFRFLPQDAELSNEADGKVSRFQKSFDLWDNQLSLFHEAYTAWFPDSLQHRRFLCRYKDPSGLEVPLAKLIKPLALPESLEEPQAVLHWARCFEFTVPPRQRSLGEMSNWNTVETMLSLRKGTVQDHAVLLTCALRGLQKDAFVCKGTVQGGKEHAWVMTREPTGVVTFWETTTGCKYHLPTRWSDDPNHKNETKGAIERKWQERKVNFKWMSLASKRALMTRAQHIQHMDNLTKLPISPWKELDISENVVCLPYETIEVVFNGEQVWGNMCNAHPASIYYDMEDDPKSWYPLVIDEHVPLIRLERTSVIPVGPKVTSYTAEAMGTMMENEIKECVRMVRLRTGFETYFVDDTLLCDTIRKYLDWLELECRLDSDWCYDEQDKMRPPWSCPSPFNAFAYVQKCREAWSQHWKTKEQLFLEKQKLPVRPNHVLSGVPLHFSCCDVKEIRYYLMHCDPIQEYLQIPKDEVLYFVVVKIFPLPNSVASTWLFIGCQISLPQEVIMELHMAEMKKKVEGDPNASSDDEDNNNGKIRKKVKKKKKDKETE